jgi:hypothetical protein
MPEKRKIELCHVSSVMEITLPTTRDVGSARTFKRKHTHLPLRRYTLLPHKSNKPYALNQEYHILKNFMLPQT